MTTTRLEAAGAALAIDDDPSSGQARFELWTDRGAGSARAGADLVTEAVSRARALHTSHVLAALDASAPSCGVVLDALRQRVGSDVRQISMHRAGASVMLDLELVG